MLRNDFVICGSVPCAWVWGSCGKTTGRIGWVLGAFAFSGLFHEYGQSFGHFGPSPPFDDGGAAALWVATFPDVLFRTSRFFFGQGVSVVLEYVFTRITGIKVRGVPGWIWTVFWLVWFAEPMVTCWSASPGATSLSDILTLRGTGSRGTSSAAFCSLTSGTGAST